MTLLDTIHRELETIYAKILADIHRVTVCPIYAHYPQLREQKLAALTTERQNVEWTGEQFGHPLTDAQFR